MGQVKAVPSGKINAGSTAEAEEGEWAKVKHIAENGGLALALLLTRDVLRDEIDEMEVRRS